MKFFTLPALSFFCFAAFTLSNCTLEKDPDIPTGTNNIDNPEFSSITITSDTSNKFIAIANLTSLGNLDIKGHGWVWSETSAPTLNDFSLDSGELKTATFTAEITGLSPGKTYYLRPFVTTGMGTVYGPEQCSFLGLKFTINTDTEIFQGADVQFNNITPGNYSYSWNFGDGNTSTAVSPKHTFNTKGTFTVRLTATDNDCSAVREITLTVVDDPFKDYWVDIPAGSFIMGCTSEQEPCDSVVDPDNGIEAIAIPVHQVSVDPFFMGKTEVTQGQWKAVMKDNPSFWTQCGDNCPVEAISWDNIVKEFIPALNRKTGRSHRLPSEAEWEYAARAGQPFRFSGSDTLDQVAWRFIQGVVGTHPVAAKQPNAFGLYDMSGHLWEFVEDDAHEDYIGAPADGSAWKEEPRGDNRMARGGGWGSGPSRCRVSFRTTATTGDRSDDWGFRLARSKQ